MKPQPYPEPDENWPFDALRDEVDKGLEDIENGRIATITADELKHRLRHELSAITPHSDRAARR